MSHLWKRKRAMSASYLRTSISSIRVQVVGIVRFLSARRARLLSTVLGMRRIERFTPLFKSWCQVTNAVGGVGRPSHQIISMSQSVQSTGCFQPVKNALVNTPKKLPILREPNVTQAEDSGISGGNTVYASTSILNLSNVKVAAVVFASRLLSAHLLLTIAIKQEWFAVCSAVNAITIWPLSIRTDS